jgi:hypothetical protein
MRPLPVPSLNLNPKGIEDAGKEQGKPALSHATLPDGAPLCSLRTVHPVTSILHKAS